MVLKIHIRLDNGWIIGKRLYFWLMQSKNREGVFDVALPSNIKACSFLPSGIEITPDMAKIVLKPNGGIRTAYPYNSLYPN